MVTDLVRAKQWPSSTANTGHRRDFYRTSGRESDPLMIEEQLSKMEDNIAPIFKALDQESREPTEDELDVLIWFLAVQWVRVPAFRPFIHGVADRFYRRESRLILAALNLGPQC